MSQPKNREFSFEISPFSIGDAVAFAVALDGFDQVALVIHPMKSGVHTYRRKPEGSWEYSQDMHRPWVQTRVASMLSWVFDGVRRAAWFAAQTWPSGWYTSSEFYSNEASKPIKPNWVSSVHEEEKITNRVIRSFRPPRKKVGEE